MRYARHSANSDEKRSAHHVQALTPAQLTPFICGRATTTYGIAPIAIDVPVMNSGECRLSSAAAPTV